MKHAPDEKKNQQFLKSNFYITIVFIKIMLTQYIQIW